MAFPKRRNLHESSPRHLVIIGSKNHTKVKCTEEAFQMAFGGQVLVQGLNIGPGGDKPATGDEETSMGAYNRAANSKNAFPEADFWVGIEGGTEAAEEELKAYAWVVIMDKNGKVGRAKTAVFSVPKQAAALMNQEIEPENRHNGGHAQPQVRDRGDAVGLLTNGAVETRDLYKQAIILALIPFLKKDIYG